MSFATGKMPSFMYGRKEFRDVPVFCLHSARHSDFERQLAFLQRNGYRALDSEQLYERISDPGYSNNGKEIVLTFDDGMASVWTVAFPLLQKYEQRIVSFILPGLIEEGEAAGPNITDTDDAAGRDCSDSPLCNWKEIKIMHDSGLVDFQSHGMYHSLISVSPTIVDFVHPDFDTHHYGNIHIPVFQDGARDQLRDKVLGHPIYKHSPRLLGLPRYLDSPALRSACAEYVSSKGGKAFFEQRTWRKQLHGFAAACRKEEDDSNRFESESQVRTALTEELSDSKLHIERRLNKTVHSFCFPWFGASERSARLALECGYDTIYLGVAPGFRTTGERGYPTAVARLQEEYLFALPGSGGKGVLAPITYKLTRRL
ncbi:MAG: polysaccharide deacetylase family protein [Gammaproteobacteria bacterium]